MGWAGSASSAILSLRYNRSLTSNKKAISSFRERAKKIRMSKMKAYNNERIFVPKSYSKIEYDMMTKRIKKDVKSDLVITLMKAIIVFIILTTILVALFNYVQFDNYLFWAR
tara:strand:+ start:473 stop:808 length:336 start_codon:yes stop_codon:yes gene_type:complete